MTPLSFHPAGGSYANTAARIVPGHIRGGLTGARPDAGSPLPRPSPSLPCISTPAPVSCVCCAPCLRGLLLLASSAFSAAALTRVPPSSPQSRPLLCAGPGAHATLPAGGLLLGSFLHLHRVPRTGMGQGSVSHVASAQCVLVDTKSDVQNGGNSTLENSHPGLCRAQGEHVLNLSIF